MMLLYWIRLALPLLILAICGCQKELPDDSIELSADVRREHVLKVDITKISQEYKTLRLMTPKPVFVNPELAMLCVGASKEMVDAARLDHGPHANSSVNVFMNPSAAKAFSQKSEYPVDAIIVKEKRKHGFYTKELSDWKETGNGVGGMVKRENGFDSANGDWEYFYFETVDSIESGRMRSCIECHSKAKDTDYVFGSWSDSAPAEVDSTVSGY